MKDLSKYYTLSNLLIGVLIFLYLLPIWLFSYFPTQDGISHVYNSHIITDYNNPDFEFSDYYDIHWFPFPNWLSHISLTLLMYIFSPLFAEKVFLSLYVVLFPVSIHYFLNVVRPNQDSLVILSFTFIYNYLLLMGFYNFAVSVPLFFLTLGFWWKYKDNLDTRRIVCINLLIIITYFSHLISYAFVLFSIAFLTVIHYRRDLKKIVLTGCSVLPGALLLLVYLPSSDLLSGRLPEIGFGRIGGLLQNLIGMKVLVAYNQNQSWIAYCVFTLILFLTIYTLWKSRMKLLKENTGQTLFLVLFCVLFCLYLILPNNVGPGGWVNDRLLILSMLLVLACFRLSENPRWRRVFTGVVTLLAVVNIIYIGILCKRLNTELDEFNAFVEKVEDNSVILPLQFDSGGESLKVGIFVNGANYYCLDNGCINLGNYEVQFDYFPVHFKPTFETPTNEKEWVQTVHWRSEQIDLCDYADNVDYLLLWGDPDSDKVSKEIEACYSLIEAKGRLKLYKGRRER
ncbi:hypothetical protein C6497_14505 [Candidatus Poribacteria bacterium]|nr:MAG: hypothetical protein C6497_14505 [Candidatus Poribacteria bacterium]